MRRAIVIFVKHPEPGRVKTRLAATVGADRAAEIYRQLAAEVFSRLPDDSELIAFFDPPERRAEIERWLTGLASGKPLHFFSQSPGDLGTRLKHAFAETFALGFDQIAVIGTDCPEIDAALFHETWTALDAGNVVLGPSEDGGYYLIALAGPCAPLFHEIPWSTDRVLAETLARAVAENRRVHRLPVRCDVDTEEDWRKAERRLVSARFDRPSYHMELLQPIVFEPLLMERVWGGRRLETLLHKRLPGGSRVGESWEIVDRPEAQSVVHEGPLHGRTLHELWTEFREAVFGTGLPESERFPLLFKLLDAQERLSVQVHPPASVAAALGGEPKTEMWYFIDTQPDSDLYAGLKRGVAREDFVSALEEGRVADLVHRVRVHPGDAFFLPSGRIHAIGEGNVIFEVQQNSDTTYRVFDWNRLGLDGKPRELHVDESLQSIDFDDPEPGVVEQHGETVVGCEYFHVEKWILTAPRTASGPGFAIFTVIAGRLECAGRKFAMGDFFLIPATLADRELKPLEENTTVLRTTIPRAA